MQGRGKAKGRENEESEPTAEFSLGIRGLII
jgi:hypothetical protein